MHSKGAFAYSGLSRNRSFVVGAIRRFVVGANGRFVVGANRRFIVLKCGTRE